MTPRQRIIHTHIEPVARKHQLEASEIFSTSKTPHIVIARDEAAYMLWLHFGRHLSKTAQFFRRNHSSIYSAIGRHLMRQGVTPDQDKRVAYVARSRPRMRRARYKYVPRRIPERETVLATVVEPIMVRHGFELADFFVKPTNQTDPLVPARTEAIVTLHRDVFDGVVSRTAAFIPMTPRAVRAAIDRVL